MAVAQRMDCKRETRGRKIEELLTVVFVEAEGQEWSKGSGLGKGLRRSDQGLGY